MQKTYKVTIFLNEREHTFNIIADNPELASAEVGRVYGIRPSKVELLQDDRMYFIDY